MEGYKFQRGGDGMRLRQVAIPGVFGTSRVVCVGSCDAVQAHVTHVACHPSIIAAVKQSDR